MRLILDTNVWSYVADGDKGHEMKKMVRDSGIRLVLPPSILVEVLQLARDDVRDRIVRTVTGAQAQRLRTEADLEVHEIIASIRRYRPTWLRQLPDTATERRLREFWTNRLWKGARRDSTSLHRYVLAGASAREFVRGRQELQRTEYIDVGVSQLDLLSMTGELTLPRLANWPVSWPEGPVEVWRAQVFSLYWQQLLAVPRRAAITGEDTTYADWFNCWVDPSVLRKNEESFVDLFVEDMEIDGMPRNWLRWAVSSVQPLSKVTSGNPVDEQHAAYLLDADMFLTADKRYFAALAEVRRQAPFPFAEPRLLSGDLKVELLERIERAIA